MAVTIEPMSPASLVTLINEWGTVPRVAAGEQDRPFPSTKDLAVGVSGELVQGLDDDSLQRIADALHPIFTAATPAECADLVTSILAAVGVHPVLHADGEQITALWTVDEPRDALAAAAALTLRQYVAERGFARLGVCAGRDCADVYMDASPTRDRRYCSVTCQNRARAAAFRRRTREKAT